MPRIEKLRNLLESGSLDALMLAGPVNRRYASGFTGTSGIVVISRDDAWLVTDFRYTQQAAAQCPGFKIITLKTEEKVHEWVLSHGFDRVGFEADIWTIEAFEPYKTVDGPKWIPIHKDLMNLRMIKEPEEVDAIEKAAAIADRGFQHILKFIRPGVTENEVALELEFFMRKAGASALSFDSIIASGVRSSMPHGVASGKVIESGDMLTMDFGCIFEGYCSDMTRTLVVGEASAEQKKIYDIVLQAQLASLEMVKPGVRCSDVDLAGRSIIDGAGYGLQFGHGTGHGVGLEIHEEPRLNTVSEAVLAAGMIVTVEPGIYIPDFGGVRIEDLVVVTETGYRLLSASPKQLIEWVN